MQKNFLIKEQENRLYYSAVEVLSPQAMKRINHPLRMRILTTLAKKPMYPAELAKELNVHEQKIYYHINQMHEAGVLDIVEKRDIRGTTAKKLSPKCLNFAFSLTEEWKPFEELKKETDARALGFFSPFIKDGTLNSNIVVGSPDPHGPFKARARDGHYAIELALFLGGLCSVGKEFSTRLDVDVDLTEKTNFIIVGGPVTNLICAKLNDTLSVKFSDKRPWGIRSKIKTYTDDSVGLITRIPNPFNPDSMILMIAGIRFIGTKAAVMAVTRSLNLVLHRFTGQKEFFCIVQGFDIDGDGKIDTVEVLE